MEHVLEPVQLSSKDIVQMRHTGNGGDGLKPPEKWGKTREERPAQRITGKRAPVTHLK